MNEFVGILSVFVTLGALPIQIDAAESTFATEVKRAQIFVSPIEWVGETEPPTDESSALRQAIELHQVKGEKGGYANIEAFLAQYPESRWSPSLRMHLAERYRVLGRYSAASTQWEKCWLATKGSKDDVSRSIAVRALTSWLKLLGSLGRQEQMEGLMAEAEERGLFDTPYAPALRASREGMAVMNSRPGDAFRCGSLALAQVMKSIDPTNSLWQQIHVMPSPPGGFTLQQLLLLGETNNFQGVAVQRLSGEEIPVPSIVHWKLNHYAAIVEKQGDRYKVVDPTFGGHKLLDAETINAEATGNFLLPGPNVPAGWRQLTAAEAARIYGRGYSYSVDDDEDDTDEDDDDPCDPPDANDGPEGGGEPCPEDAGLATWRVSAPYTTVWISDVPLYYRNARGGWEKLRLSYKHRALPRSGDTIGGFGDKWECNWIGFLEEDSGDAHIKNYQAGGGIIGYVPDGTPEERSRRRMYSIPGGFKIESSGSARGQRLAVFGGESGGGGSPRPLTRPAPKPKAGSENRYGASLNFGPITRYYRTNQMDRYGRNVYYAFNNASVGGTNVMRLVSRTDKDGKICTFGYTNTAFPRLITSVTNPYSLTAHFIYDELGQLTNITDMSGLSSSFKYHSDGSITNLITDYGTNTFKYYNKAGSPGVWARGVEITEPTGDKQLAVYQDSHHRISYHWNRKQYAALSPGGKADPIDGMSDDDFKLAPYEQWNASALSILIDSPIATSGPVDPVWGERSDSVSFTYPSTGATRLADGIVASSYFDSDEWQIPRNDWGRPTEIRYFRNGNPVSFTNVYNADGRRLEKVWGPSGEPVRGYGYDAVKTNLLTSVTNALGEVIRYTHDSGVHVTSVTLPSGLVTTNRYYAGGTYAGFLETRIDEGFRTNSYTWINGNLEWHTNELGLATKRTWDKLNRLTSIVYPDGTTVSNVYDKLDVVATKDRLDQWTYFGYNRVRQLVAQTNANGQVTEWEYCDCGSPSEMTRWYGSTPLVTQYSYNMAGRLTSVTYPDSYTLSYEYDLGGRLNKVTEPSGTWLSMIYGDYDQLQSLRMVSASYYYDLAWRTYDQYGRLAMATDRSGVTITNAYDILGRLTNRATLGINGYVSNVVSYAYTARGLTNFTDELGEQTWFVYDAAGRLLAQTNANDEVLQFTYNAADQIMTLLDGKGQQTSWAYDEFGRVISKYDAVREIFRYQYNQNDQLTNRWTAQKGYTFYRYDAIGNLTNVDYPNTFMDVALKYDPLNRLTNVTDMIGTTKFTYTEAGQLLSEDGPWADDTVSYSYNADRRRAALSIAQPNASAWTQSYGYDEWTRLQNITSPAGSFNYFYGYVVTASGTYPMDRPTYLGLTGTSTDRIYIQNEYDDLARLTSTQLRGLGQVVRNQHDYRINQAHQRTRQTFQDGNYVDYTYDDIGQLKTAKGWESDTTTPRLNEQFGYAYDKAWNLERRTNNALVQYFGVNNLNELTNATRSGTLTVAGVASQPGANISSVSVSGTGLTTGNADVYADGSWAKSGATLADGNNTYTATATDTYGRTASDTINLSLPSTNNFSYDYNGNLTNDGRRVFEYDYENQLTNVYVASAWRSEFKYDAFGRRRVRKEYTWQSSAWVLTNEVRYVYDGMLTVQERDANNLAMVSYTRGNDLSGSLQGAGGIGGLLARTDHSTLISQPSTAHAYYHADGNGNITAMVDTNGIIVARYQYDPYGNLLGMSGPMAEANTYRFSSKEWCANAGLYYFGFRFYEPNLQRWLNRDPLDEEYDLNLYRFVFDDPINYIDLDGLSGTITIHSSGDGGSSSTSGHSWICYKPDGGAPTTTYGTWGNNPRGLGNGLHENLEQGRTGDASRSKHIDDAAEKLLMDKIDEYKKQGEKGWKLFKPCSSFACDAWEAGTGERLPCGFPSTPSTLKKSINKKNTTPPSQKPPVLRSPKDQSSRSP